MPVKPNTRFQIVQRRALVADLYVQGYTQCAIAEKVGSSQPTVSADLAHIRGEWRESAVRDFDAARDLELQKLDRLERVAWEAYERSQKPAQTAVISGDGPAKRERRSLKNQHGDPRFLEVIHKCIAQRRALLGLDMQPMLGALDHDDLAPTARRDRLVAFVAAIGQSPATPAVGAGLGGGQPRLLGAPDQ